MSIYKDINDLIKLKSLTNDDNIVKKILILDIETSPSLAYVWKLWKEDIPLQRLVESGEVLCYSAKWVDSNEISFISNYFPGHEQMITTLWELLNEADIVVTYNGDAFDLKHINSEFLKLGLAAPSPYRSIDLYKIVRSRFKLTSNKLDHVAQVLGLGSKFEHSGFELWLRCMNNKDDHEAWEEMGTYNKQDVILTEKVYFKLRNWIKNHPLVSVESLGVVCPVCGSEEVGILKDHVYSIKTKYELYHCFNCSSNLQGTKSIKTTLFKSV